MSLLRQARAAADRLIVGLNSDASVGRLKGPTRPIQDADTRATVLAALASVDAVVVFDEDTPAELIAAIAPDALVKGADYAVDEVVGADIVTAAGGRGPGNAGGRLQHHQHRRQDQWRSPLILPFHLERCPMAVEIPFVRQSDPQYGVAEDVAPGLRRVLANNPSASPTMAPALISSAAARSR